MTESSDDQTVDSNISISHQERGRKQPGRRHDSDSESDSDSDENIYDFNN